MSLEKPESSPPPSLQRPTFPMPVQAARAAQAKALPHPDPSPSPHSHPPPASESWFYLQITSRVGVPYPHCSHSATLCFSGSPRSFSLIFFRSQLKWHLTREPYPVQPVSCSTFPLHINFHLILLPTASSYCRDRAVLRVCGDPAQMALAEHLLLLHIQSHHSDIGPPPALLARKRY